MSRWACRRTRALVGAMVLLAGCRKPAAPPANDTGVPAAPATSGASYFSDLAPGDTAGVLSLMRSTMSGIDARLDSLERRDTVLAPDSTGTTDSMVVADTTLPRREITVWLDHGTPMKLRVREPAASASGTDETQYWFLSGELAVEYGPDDGAALDNGHIVLWTDGTLAPMSQADPQARMARELELAATVKRWLGLFGIEVP